MANEQETPPPGLTRRQMLHRSAAGLAGIAAGAAAPAFARAERGAANPEAAAPIGSWTRIVNNPSFAASNMLLLTDGTVMCQDAGGSAWWKLTPNAFGDYVNGTWSRLASTRWTRLYYASAVLRDGRVFVSGGEYSNGGSETNKTEIYDPVADAWTEISPPPGWNNVGDAPCSVLPDGSVLLGSIFNTRTAIYDPVANMWSASANKDDASSEETWAILPDGTVLNVECTRRPRAEKYLYWLDRWVSAGNVPVDLVQASSLELGPFAVLPDMSCLCIGATGNTALYYMPDNPEDPGTWAVGPTFPPDKPGNRPMQAKDAPCAVLPNGKVLITVSPAGEGGTFPSPTYYFEYDGGVLNPVPAPPISGGPAYVGRMLVLPTGQVAYATGQRSVYVYTPDGSPDPSWKPTIVDAPIHVDAGGAYTLYGTQINGLNEGAYYGDDASMSSNYPLVRIRNLDSGKVWYCRTGNHSIMAIATGDAVHSTDFTVPDGIEDGTLVLEVVANGIASDAWQLS